MIKVYSQIDFNNVMKSNGIDDSNVENEKDSIFISITNRNGEIEHWFKENHKNVINLDFDDTSSDNEELRTISDKQAESLMFFIDDNLSKSKDDIDVYINNNSTRFDYIEESISNNTFIAICLLAYITNFNLAF